MVSDMFGGKMTNSSISHLYRDLNCQHHFVQRQFDEKPNIPALTPLGFQCWMTHLIQAHPEEESMRLTKASMEMPISNADDRRERFPKQLSRRLFPKQPNRAVRDLFEDSVLADPVIELPRHSSNIRQPPPSNPNTDRPTASAPPEAKIPPPPQAQVSTPPPSQAPHLTSNVSNNERERKPYSPSSSETAPDDRNQSQPIERERKPYSAVLGYGKSYNSDDAGRPNVKPQRASSLRSTPRPAPPTDDELRTRPGHVRAGSQSGPRPNIAKPYRIRSPSVQAQSNPYTRSEGNIPPQAYNNTNTRASHIHDDSDNELDKTCSREARNERSRRRAPDDMPRPYVTQSYPTQPKPIFDPPQYQRPQPGDPSNGYGNSYNGNPYPPPRYG